MIYLIKFRHKGNFEKTDKFFERSLNVRYINIFKKYGELGVRKLSENTPIDTGEVSYSWSYEIFKTKKGVSISWNNSVFGGDIPVVILLRYGHATGNGGYIQANDFVTPAIKKVIEDIKIAIDSEVNK